MGVLTDTLGMWCICWDRTYSWASCARFHASPAVTRRVVTASLAGFSSPHNSYPTLLSSLLPCLPAEREVRAMPNVQLLEESPCESVQIAEKSIQVSESKATRGATLRARFPSCSPINSLWVVGVEGPDLACLVLS